jgi:hypothetical protein
MSQSTPISQIKQQQSQQMPPPQEPSVEDMLKEMDVPDNINMDSMNYSMDESQIPPPKMDQNFLHPNDTQQMHPPIQEEKKNESSNSLLGINLGDSSSMMTKCINLVKHSGIIFLLVFVVSLPQVNRSVFTKIPGMLEESGEINIKGVLLKSVIVTLLFLVSSFFL